MEADQKWAQKVMRVLDRYEIGSGIGKMTLKSVADQSGVSRQTIWRNKKLFERFQQVRASIKDGNGSLIRPGTDMRVRALMEQVEVLEREQAILINNIVQMFRRLQEKGLDARVFLGRSLMT